MHASLDSTISYRIHWPFAAVILTSVLSLATHLRAQGTTPRLTSIVLDAENLEGGQRGGGSVTLSGPAPRGGTAVTLSGTPPSIATVPVQVTVAENQTVARFTFTTNTVTFPNTLVVTATLNGLSLNDTLVINPPAPPDPEPPTTLEIGAFTLSVIDYSNADWDATKGLFAHAAGTATLQLECGGGAALELPFAELTIDPVDDETGTVTQGSVIYPGSPPPPIAIEIAGFRLLIDGFTLEPASAEASMRVELPPGFVDAAVGAVGCQRPSIDLGVVDFQPNCRVFEILPTQAFGPWMLSQLGITIQGSGLVVDLSTFDKAPTPPYPFTIPFWRGLFLIDGETQPVVNAVSNTGYLLAEYQFANARITSSGFSGQLDSPFQFDFLTLAPLGFRVRFPEASLEINNSLVSSGELRNGTIRAPRLAVTDENRLTVEGEFETLTVQSDLGLLGRVTVSEEIFWGELTNAMLNAEVVAYSIDPSTLDGGFYISGTPAPPFLPLAPDGSFLRPDLKDEISLLTDIQSQSIQGLTLIFDGPTQAPFSIYSPDTPGGGTSPPPTKDLPAPITTGYVIDPWITIGARGVHGQISSFQLAGGNDRDLGPTYRPDYDGGAKAGSAKLAPFDGTFAVDVDDPSPDGLHLLLLKFIDSAVYESDGQGQVALAAPTGAPLDFKEINITSTARIAAAKIVIDPGSLPQLDYWEVNLVQRSNSAYAGVMHVPSGRIFLTQAGLFEPRHFKEPFWLTWAVLRANGSFGELEFDRNHTGQRFDGLPFVPEVVALSDYDPADASQAKAFVQAAGTIHFDFFGVHDLDVRDHVHLAPDPVNDGRDIAFGDDGLNGADPSELDIAGNWSGAFGHMEFALGYDTGDYDGFIGPGTTGLLLVAGDLEGSVDISRERSCISIHDGIDDGYESVQVPGFVNFSSLGRTTGCGCIEKGVLKRIHLQSEEENTSALNYIVRTGTYKSIEMDITPSSTSLDVHGSMGLNMGPGLVDMQVDGQAGFVIDLDEGFVEGHLDGRFDTAGFLGVSGALNAEGQLGWHLGDVGDGGYHSIQGKVAVAIVSPFMISGRGFEGGFYAGLNAPSSEAWVLDADSKYVDFVLPARLTGVYGYAKCSRSLNIYVLSGGYELYGGLGFFIDESFPSVIGQMRAHVWGKVLGGLLSASAWSQMLFQAHPTNPVFAGSVGLKVCVLFLCADVGLSLELSKHGFDIDF